MNSLTRLVGYSAVLLLVFLGAALTAQSWLHRQTQELRAEAIEARRAQFLAAAPVVAPPDHRWSAAQERILGALVGGTVTIRPPATMAAPADPAMLSFDQPLAGTTPALSARVVFPAAAMTRLIALQQRVVVGLALLAAVLLGLWCLLVAFAWTRPPHEVVSSTPWANAQAEMSGLTHLARTSVAQGEELGRERDVRRRAEEDAQLRQRLLAQSLESKIRLGHDLHDGIIQSLYAVGLTLESVRPLITSDPGEADGRLTKCLQSLNATIRDVRAYITGLGPENLRRIGFAQALEALVAELRADRAVQFDLRIDEDATALLSPEQSIDALQIAREAISNSLRHGRATAITVRLQHSDREIGLLVQDNGCGFDPAQGSGGHGLGNMRARAERLRATVRVDSRPGAGTRVVVTLAVSPPL
ncbi:MAG TPA: sensor histidine kinase [Opitutaceae bacterium]|nr:sensor histidine kinase [Opitutaceae bacterium]